LGEIEEAGPMENDDRPSEGRREFIAKCGRFALVTPPAITLLLAADGRNYAEAASGGNKTEKDTKVNKIRLRRRIRRRRRWNI
jgi:hypothetical protein